MRESVHAAHKTADLPQRDKLRWGTFCLKLNKGSPFRTTILYVLLHTIFMCLKISTWWTWICQLVLVTGPSLNTQLRNHPSSWFVYKVCAMHAGVCVWGYSLHRPNHSEIGTSMWDILAVYFWQVWQSLLSNPQGEPLVAHPGFWLGKVQANCITSYSCYNPYWLWWGKPTAISNGCTVLASSWMPN